MEPNDKIISVLNGLIETCKDAEKGYWEASNAMEYGFYRALLEDYARQRTVFAAELQSVVRHLGGTPDRKGTMAGNLHRGWMNLRLALKSQSDRAIALECERGESIALKHYRNALKTDLPGQIKSILEKQCAVIRSTRQRIHTITQDKATNS
ncbi:PA2169 family four-helix-bundle protein [bacterium]|nr:PA2169 family four-helix-bundle protein [bacterium]MCI0606495.1 PA2169 family four-helix-bundle protein [bacterium]